MAGWEDDSEVCGLRTGGLRRPRGGDGDCRAGAAGAGGEAQRSNLLLLRVVGWRTISADVLATVLTGVGVLIDVWRIVTVQVDSVQRDLSAQIAAVNTRIDNILLAERRPSA